MMIVVDLISFSQLIFSGPLAESRAAGVSAMLTAYLAGSLVFLVLRRTVVISLSFFGAAAIVQAAIAAAVAEQLRAAGVTDPDSVGRIVLVACGLSTLITGLVFALLGTLRASLLAQLLPLPVLTGFLAGVGLLLLRSGVQIGAQLSDPLATLLGALGPAGADPGPVDPGALGRVGLTLCIGVCAFALPRRLPHWATYPAVILSSLLVVHLGLAWHGVDRAAAQAAGWLIDPLPTGSLFQAPAIGSLAALDPALLVPILPKIVTYVVVAVIVQILYVVTAELDLRREFDVDRVFVASGCANLVGSLFGSPVMGFDRTSTLLLHNIGGGRWLGRWLTLAVMAALLAFGAGILALLPRPLAGGALVAIGIGHLTNLALASRTLLRWELVIALAVCAATALLGAPVGCLVGIVLAMLIFAVQYAQIPALRRALSGTERRSSVIRAPDTAERLRAAGTRTRIYSLQGYLFFLNAQAIYRRAAAEAPDLRVLILDFRDCVGLDSSALVAFRKIGQLAEQRGFDLLLVHLGPTALRQVERGRLAANARIRILDTLDAALREAEATLLAETGTAGAGGGRALRPAHGGPAGLRVRAGRLRALSRRARTRRRGGADAPGRGGRRPLLPRAGARLHRDGVARPSQPAPAHHHRGHGHRRDRPGAGRPAHRHGGGRERLPGGRHRPRRPRPHGARAPRPRADLPALPDPGTRRQGRRHEPAARGRAAVTARRRPAIRPPPAPAASPIWVT